MKLFFNITIILLGLVIGCGTKYPLQFTPINPADGFHFSYTDNDTGIEFMLLEAGNFTMGSPENEEGRDKDEGPQHTVYIDSFYISKYEITQSQWKEIMNKNPSHFKGNPLLPVENVSWNDVQEFIKRLNKKTGLHYRLPTEAEWEYTCRAGTQTAFFSGKEEKFLSEYAWFNNNSAGETHPVGTRMPNQWGIYDMHGNVSEWVEDGVRGYLSRTEYNPKGSPSSVKAIHRGGSWLYPAKLCRSANRMINDKDFATHIVGFRIAIDKDNIGLKSQ